MARGKSKHTEYVADGREYPAYDPTLIDIYPRLVVTNDGGQTRWMVKSQRKESIGNVGMPRLVWVRSLVVMGLSAGTRSELLISCATWRDQKWQILDFPL